MTSYRAFLEAKAPMAQPAGLPCTLDDIPTHLLTGQEIKPHQRATIRAGKVFTVIEKDPTHFATAVARIRAAWDLAQREVA